MDGKWVEIEVEEGEKYPIYRKYIKVFEAPEVHFSIQDFESPKPCDVVIGPLTYMLVRKSNGIHYEHLQSTS